MGKVIKFGTIALDEFTGIKSISGSVTDNNYDSLEVPVGTKYQVPADKIFRIGLILYCSEKAPTKISIGYGDTAVTDSAVAPVNPVTIIRNLSLEIADKQYRENIYMFVPPLKYPFIKSSNQSMCCDIVGIEE